MPKESPLGQPTVYIETYTPELLFPISRSLARDKIGITDVQPFTGSDMWTGYELSWLNLKGKPEIAVARFTFPYSSLLIESKSFKLYLNSFNQSRFASFEEVRNIMQKDLSVASQSSVSVTLTPVRPQPEDDRKEFSGICLDSQDIEIDRYETDAALLRTNGEFIEETLYSNLLKSNCLATGQPDWGSVLIRYAGPKIDREGLLRYIVSFRRHAGFAEHCVEEMFCDILNRCKPEKLTVYARYTRRGGLDINPFRSDFEDLPPNDRHYRQ